MVSSAVPVDGLLEREVALARFDRVFDRVGVGAGAVVVVQGAAGIGKSELLAAVRTRAQARGSAALSARGSEFEEEIAFGVARQLFEPMLRAASPGDRRRLLDGVAQVGARALGIEAGEPPADRFAAIHGLYWLCANRAERGPLVVVVDDVQLVDDPSLAWLGYLARRTEDLPLMLVLGLRSGDPGGERGELEGLLRDRGVERIDLKPLSAAAVGVLVRARLDHSADEDFCGACYDLTHGNPLSAVELLAAVREQGLAARGESVPALHRIAPAAVGTSVLARLGRLGDEAVALARAVAVLGRGAETAIAAALAGIDPAVAELTADRLASAQIFASVRPLEFSHPLIAAAVSNDRAPGALRVAHRRAAELLHRGGHASHALVSAHLLLCAPGDDGWVVEVLRAAARGAGASGSPETAVSYLERGLKEEAPAVVRAALLFELGAAQLLAGRAGATQRMREALELSTDHRRRAEISLALGRALLATGDAAALDAFGRGLAELAENDDDELSIELQGWSTTSSYAHDESALSPPVRARLGALLAGDARASTRPERFLLAHAAFRSAISGDRPHDQVARLASRALADGALLADSGGDVGTHGAACYALLFAGEPDLAIAELNRAIAWSRRRAVPVAFRRFSLMRGIANYMRGEIGAALGDLASADGGYEEGFTRDFPAARAYRALCLIERDDLAGASDALAVSAAEEPLLRQGNRVSYVYALARLRSAHGELREALETVRECDELVRERGARNPAATLSWRSEAALLAARLGEHDHAQDLIAEDLELARAFGAPHALGVALRAAGLIAGHQHGRELLAQSIHTLENSESQLELARSLTEHGAALRRAARRIEARAQLERGLDLAHRLGARRIAKHARAELVAAGAKPRRETIFGREALTAGELRVARLAAEGLTNRELAQALFITTATAKSHLSRIYRKLAITRRDQLADALGRRRADTAGVSSTPASRIP